MRFLLLLMLLLSVAASDAQRKPGRALEKRGDEEFSFFEYLKSAQTYQEALRSDTSSVVLRLKIAESYRMAHMPEKAKQWYDQALERDLNYPDPRYKINYAEVLIALGFRKEAEEWLRKYQEKHGEHGRVAMLLARLADGHLFTKNADLFAVKALDFNSADMDFSAYPYQRGLVFVSSRPKKRRPARPEDAGVLSLFYAEEREDGTFSTPIPFESGTMSSSHDGPVIFFADDQQRIVTRNNSAKRLADDHDLKTLELAWSSRTSSGKWSDPVSLGLASADYSVAHPAVTSDGKTLYFSSNMEGTFGASDLFVSHFQDGEWSAPRNLGNVINTAGQELFPFVYQDSLLFFASNGHPGLGGLDIFYYNLKLDDQPVVNLGAPMNSTADDFGLFMEANGASGFFSSNRKGGKGADDIYYFEEIQPFVEVSVLDSVSRVGIANAALLLSGSPVGQKETRTDLYGKSAFRLSPLRNYQLTVLAEGYEPIQMKLDPALWPRLQQAQVKISLAPVHRKTEARTPVIRPGRQKSSITNVITFSSSPLDVDVAAAAPEAIQEPEDPDGLDIPQLRVIAAEVVNDLPLLFVVKEGQLYEFQKRSDLHLSNADLNIDITMPGGAQRHAYAHIIATQLASQGYGLGSFTLIRSFFFDAGKTLIRNDACAQLDKIIEVMQSFPSIEVEMIFHADSRGSDAFNLDLSKARSEEVTRYLRRAGIPVEKIESRFVGEGQLLMDCGDLSDCDELLHQINRTVEFRFVINPVQE